MKPALLCCMLFVSPLCMAQVLSRSGNDQGATQNFSASNSYNRSDFGQLRLWRGEDTAAFDPQTEDEFCAFIRAYRVRREYKGSDVVMPAGQATCLPSSRFNVKSAVVTRTEPSPVK